MVINKIVDNINATFYKNMNNIDIRTRRQMYFRCVVCGTSCSIDGSFSNQGRRLICTGCAEKHFGYIEGGLKAYQELMAWVREEE